MGGAQARQAVPAHERDDALDHARLADGQPARCPTSGRSSLGEGAEILADRYGITREQQDEFALNSHRKAAAAWDRGAFADEVVAMEELERDENIRADTHAREARRS